MDEQTGNRLIAEFMEWPLELTTYPFKDSFDWLMQAVEKLETLPDIRVHISITGNTCSISTFRYLKKTEKETKLLAIWSAVVDFLTWYKEHK